MSWQLSLVGNGTRLGKHWSQLNCQTPRPIHPCDFLIHEKRTLAAISLKPQNELYRVGLVLYAFTNTHMCVLGRQRIASTFQVLSKSIKKQYPVCEILYRHTGYDYYCAPNP
jgi:hypothetical protein